MNEDRNLLAVARRIGAKVSEIAGVEELDEGTVIRTTDGTVMIDVPADKPDHEGRSGLMLWERPHERFLDSTFPVYAHVPAEDEAELDAGAEAVDEPPSIEELRSRVDAAALKVQAAKTPRTRTRWQAVLDEASAALTAALAAPATEPDPEVD